MQGVFNPLTHVLHDRVSVQIIAKLTEYRGTEIRWKWKGNVVCSFSSATKRRRPTNPILISFSLSSSFNESEFSRYTDVWDAV
jgi:hypothetical protein